MSAAENLGGGDASNKVKLSEEERFKLAAKLDKELDEFISGLEKRRYTEGWPEDKWQEEMEKHPFFMTKLPEDGEQLSPLMEGIQQLKYDVNENTPEELAASYKEDGNFNFKCKNYRMAVISYTEGIRQKCKDENLNAQLYNNRAAAHFFVHNFRSCYSDCQTALKIKPDYTKAKLRLAQCCFELELDEECVKLCDKLLKLKSDDAVLKLRKKTITRKLIKERNERKENIAKQKAEFDKKKILAAIQERGIQFLEPNYDDLDITSTLFPHVFRRGVHFDGTRLVWPVVIMYPEYKISDFIQEFHEDTLFSDQLSEMFSEQPEWDEEGKYNCKSVRVYFEDSEGNIHRINKNDSLGSVLCQNGFRVDKGTPVFIIFARDSLAEKKFLKNTK